MQRAECLTGTISEVCKRRKRGTGRLTKGTFRPAIMEHYEACLERGASIKDDFQYYALGYAYTEEQHNEKDRGKQG